MYNGEKYVLGKYKTRETQRMLISVGLRVMLRLTQVYLNLLNNAVKYTNPGGSIRLEISEELSGDGGVTLVCVVADTGVGISPEFQKDMYESFARVTDSRIDKIQGFGLGLAIVRRMEDLLHLLHRCQLPLIQRAEILHKRDVILHLGHVAHAGEHHHDPGKACGKAQGVAERDCRRGDRPAQLWPPPAG